MIALRYRSSKLSDPAACLLHGSVPGAISTAAIAAIAIRINLLSLLDEAIGDTLHLISDLDGLGTRLVRALRRDQSDQFRHGAFVRHLEESLRDGAEAVLTGDSGLRRSRGLRLLCRDSVQSVVGRRD